MTVTTLDSDTALVVIDLQKGIVGLPTVHPIAEVLAAVTTLTKAFRRRRLPVVFVNATGVAPGRTERTHSTDGFPKDWADLVPELDVQPRDLLITKTTWGAFTNTGLDAQLRALGVTQLVIVGIATSFGVESTARHAYELSYNVTLAIDGITDLSLEAHNHSVGRIFPGLGETGSAQEIIALLAQS